MSIIEKGAAPGWFAAKEAWFAGCQLLCKCYCRKAIHQAVDPTDYFIDPCHSQRSAGAKVVLHVDHDQRFFRRFHGCLPKSSPCVRPGRRWRQAKRLKFASYQRKREPC